MDSLDYLLKSALADTLTAVQRHFNNSLSHQFKSSSLDINVEHVGILKLLWKQDGLSQQQLSILTLKDRTLISRLIDTMEKKLLVTRIPDRNDKRINFIYLTKKGKEIKDALIAQEKKVLLKAFNSIQPGEIQACKAVLSRISDNLTTK